MHINKKAKEKRKKGKKGERDGPFEIHIASLKNPRRSICEVNFFVAEYRIAISHSRTISLRFSV